VGYQNGLYKFLVSNSTKIKIGGIKFEKNMEKPKYFSEQKQTKPSLEDRMSPQPEIIRRGYRGSGKLEGKVGFITGGTVI